MKKRAVYETKIKDKIQKNQKSLNGNLKILIAKL